MGFAYFLIVACGESTPPPVIVAPEPVLEAPAPEPATAPPSVHGVSFIEPVDGAHVKSPVHVKMGVTGMEVRRAGEMVDNSGHHHVLIDLDPITAGQQIPKDETHLHYGGADTEADVVLSPGVHKLTLQFADANHMSYGPEWAKTVTVTVE